MASPYLYQVAIPYKTGLPTDVSVNTWCFAGGGTDEGDAVPIIAGLEEFYDAIAARYSPVLNMAATRVKGYSISDPEPRAPFVDEVVDLGTSNTGGVLPEEVAYCMSFQGAPLSGVPQARRRGRIYLGPLSAVVVSMGTSGRAAVLPALLTQMADGIGLATSVWNGSGITHCVYSRTNSLAVPIDVYTADDRFDTQRRRGPEPTTRTTLLTVP